MNMYMLYIPLYNICIYICVIYVIYILYVIYMLVAFLGICNISGTLLIYLLVC